MTTSTEQFAKPLQTKPSEPILIEEKDQSESALAAAHNGSKNSLGQPPTFSAYESLKPVFPEEAGWRDIKDPETDTIRRTPLTLFDFLYPTEDDIGVVHMSQSILHQFWATVLCTIFRTYFDPQAWFIFGDAFIYWHRGSAPPTAPDVTVVPAGNIPMSADVKSYHVGEGRPLPCFVVEVTSKDTRNIDLNIKPLQYAALGIQEYLIVDIETPADEDWRLLGYRLGEGSPFYQEIMPEADGSLVFETIGLRFKSVGSSDIFIYDAQTNERLLQPEEQRTRAESAEARAEAEAAARRKTDEENESLRAEIEQLKRQLSNND